MMDLFQRNFDADAKKGVHSEIMASAEAAGALKEQLEEARQQGFDAGRAIGRQEAQGEFDESEADRFVQERDTIREQLTTLVANDAKQQRDTERDIVELFLGITERVIPELLEKFGSELAVEHIRQSVQQVRTDPILTIRAHPEVTSFLEEQTPEWLVAASNRAQIDLMPDPEMARGAAQVVWKSGRLEYDLEAACAAVWMALTNAAKEFQEVTQKAG